MRIIHAFVYLIRGFYDLLASYLLAWVVFFAGAAYGFHALSDALAVHYEFGTQELMWKWISNRVEVSPRWARFWVYLVANVVVLYIFRRLVTFVQTQLEKIFDVFKTKFERSTYGAPIRQAIFQLLFSGAITAMLVPFVVQPTMVPLDNRLESWGWRMTNLVDGSASDALVESAVGFYRKFYATPQVQAKGLSVADFDRASEHSEVDDFPTLELIPNTPPAPPKSGDAVPPASPDSSPTAEAQKRVRPPPTPVGKQPMMDRWDPLIREATQGDPDWFAKTKAFMWVESAGRQFAVSSTGCSGLMQFCVGTARTEPYRSIYGVGEVYPCGCGASRCRIPKPVQRALETGGQAALEKYGDEFPCDLSDARFDARKAITAGATYIGRLSKRFGGNIYLMYIGYNSGPAIARKVYARLDKKSDASIAEIEQHLTDVLTPYYGKKSARRARSLLQIHLPKIRRAEMRFRQSSPAP